MKLLMKYIIWLIGVGVIFSSIFFMALVFVAEFFFVGIVFYEFNKILIIIEFILCILGFLSFVYIYYQYYKKELVGIQ